MSELFNIGYKDIELIPSDIEKFIGYADREAPKHFQNIIGEVLKSIEHCAEPMGGYSIEQAVFSQDKNEIIICDEVFSPGKLIQARLKEAKEIAIFVCTVGCGITRMTEEFQKKGDILHSYICDSAGSVLVEKAMDYIQFRLKEKVLHKGEKLTNRYSPGYCEWDVSEQKKLFNILPESFCGVTLTGTCLMNPIKSVSGFIGIGKDVKFHKHDCELCKMGNCTYRNK